jgi:hypothetical protein
MKLELFAEARDKLTIRLENLDDEGQISEVDLEGIAYCLVNQINPSFGGTLQIQELSLNANMKYEDMVSAKLAWKAIGESYPQKIAVNNDYTAVEMGPQRLRVFSVEYISNQTFLQ